MIAARRGVAGDKHQIGAFGFTPPQGLVVAGKGQRLAGTRRWAKRDAWSFRVKDRVGGVGGVKVPAEQPLQCSVALWGGQRGGGAFGRVDTQQVVEPVPPAARLLQEAGVRQALQQVPGLCRAGGSQRRRRRHAHRGPGMQG